MDLSQFITVGENIHCTRVVKSGGSRTTTLPGGAEAVSFKYRGERCLLPVPENWTEISPPYGDGNIRHIALAIHHALNGSTNEERQLGETYLEWAAERQIRKSAVFLDVNVDEFTGNAEQRSETMVWLAGFLASRYETPLSIDSSNTATLEAGLGACRPGTTPLVNSVSMEREDAVEIVIESGADAVVSPAAASGLPSTPEDRLANFDVVIKTLGDRGMAHEKMHLDPLVFPISVDPSNGKGFFDTCTMVKERYPAVNLTGGLSNISFGMPNRKLLNMVFTWLFVQAGGNGGIIDPVQMPVAEVANLDPDAEPFKLARGVLEGTDMFGGEYIAAFRDGRLG